MPWGLTSNPCLFVSKDGCLSIRYLEEKAKTPRIEDEFPTGMAHACKVLQVPLRKWKRTRDGALAIYEEE